MNNFSLSYLNKNDDKYEILRKDAYTEYVFNICASFYLPTLKKVSKFGILTTFNPGVANPWRMCQKWHTVVSSNPKTKLITQFFKKYIYHKN